MLNMQSITGIILLLISLWFIVMNGIIFCKTWILKKEAPSVGGFIGGICGAIGILLLAEKEYRWLCIIPALIDWGSIPLIIRLIYVLIKDTWKKP